MSLAELDEIIANVSERIHKRSELIWGASISPDMGDNIRLTVCLSGVKTPYLETKADADTQIEELWHSIENTDPLPKNVWAEEEGDN